MVLKYQKVGFEIYGGFELNYWTSMKVASMESSVGISLGSSHPHGYKPNERRFMSVMKAYLVVKADDKCYGPEWPTKDQNPILLMCSFDILSNFLYGFFF